MALVAGQGCAVQALSSVIAALLSSFVLCLVRIQRLVIGFLLTMTQIASLLCFCVFEHLFAPRRARFKPNLSKDVADVSSTFTKRGCLYRWRYTHKLPFSNWTALEPAKQEPHLENEPATQFPPGVPVNPGYVHSKSSSRIKSRPQKRSRTAKVKHKHSLEATKQATRLGNRCCRGLRVAFTSGR